MTNSLKWSKLYLFFVFVLLYVPILYLVYFSFNAGGTMNEFTGFTFEHYSNVLSDQRLIQIVIHTLLVALVSSTVATVIGTLGAIGIYYVKNNQIKEALLKDRKSTRLNSSHVTSSYAVCCLKKKIK